MREWVLHGKETPNDVSVSALSNSGFGPSVANRLRTALPLLPGSPNSHPSVGYAKRLTHRPLYTSNSLQHPCTTMVNTLTGKAGLKLGPVLFETLVRHYFERVGDDADEQQKARTTQLRKDELLYDEVFTVVKVRLLVSFLHVHER